MFKFKWNLHEEATIVMQENDIEIVAYYAVNTTAGKAVWVFVCGGL